MSDVILALKKHGVNELIYAVRGTNEDGHWYANMGYYAVGAQHGTYSTGTVSKPD